MDTRTLEIFKAVVAEGTVSKAAVALNYVQSNVTARIHRLEEEIGAKLFYRSRRGMTLTPSGAVLLGYVDRALRVFDEARRAVAESAGVVGPLRLGSMESTLAARLPPVLAAYRRRFPRVRLSLATGPTDRLVDDLLAHKLDAALVGGRVHRPEILQEVAFTETIVLVTDAACAGPAEIAERSLLAFKQGCSYRALAEHWLRISGLAPVEIAELGTLDGILACVAAGVGVTLMPESVVAKSSHAAFLRTFPVGGPDMTVDTMIIRHRDAVANAALDNFLEILHAHAGAA